MNLLLATWLDHCLRIKGYAYFCITGENMEIDRAFYDTYCHFRNRMQSLHILNLCALSNDLEEIEAAERLVRDLPIQAP